jgi:hypothetical protein
MASKYRLTAREQSLVVEGLNALAREHQRMAADARRLGYPAEARSIESVGVEAASLAALAESVRVERITVRY